MHARVITVRVPPARLADAVRIVREVVVPPLQQRPGFQHFLLLTDPATGTVIAISRWATEEALRASEPNPLLRALAARLMDVVAAPAAPAIAHYVVALSVPG